MISEYETRLLSITKGCRPDMHEPDEQGLSARVIGDKLDNAYMEEINPEFLENGWQELIVILERDYGTKGKQVEKFNLSTLIALARIGAEYDKKKMIL